MPDRDILMSLIDKYIEPSFVMGSTLHYMIKQVDIFIARRIQDVQEKKPGALTQGHLKVIWICMIRRLYAGRTTKQQRVVALRGKFNLILEERLLDGNADTHRIMSIKVGLEGFDQSGNLTSSGKEDMWKEINRGMKKYDIKLLPRQPGKDRFRSNIPSRKLPTPPVKHRCHNTGSQCHHDKPHSSHHRY